jgi:3-(3-hydroxy-phenyl)propionate hydroxylase
MDLFGADGDLIFQYRPAAGSGPLGWSEGYMFEQPALERSLRERLGELPTASMRLGYEVQSIEQLPDDTGVVVSAVKDGESIECRARYVVGCCGADSITRRTIDTESHDYAVDSDWLVLDIEVTAPTDLPDVTVQYCEPSRPCTYVCLPNNRVRFEFRLLPGEAKERMTNQSVIEGLLSRWIGPEAYQMDRAAVYTFHGLIADRWRSGRVFLAGDAAHQMPPFLGQGMCAGVRDAANLEWKLDLVVRGLADASLLDTYRQERIAHVRRIIETDIYLGDIIQTTEPKVAAGRDAEARKDGKPGQLSPRLYPLGPGLCSDDPTAGLPFPQPVTADGAYHDDVLGSGFALVGEVGTDPESVRLMEHLGVRAITNALEPIRDWLAANGVAAALVRPDRIVLATVTEPSDLGRALLPLAGHVPVDAAGASS